MPIEDPSKGPESAPSVPDEKKEGKERFNINVLLADDDPNVRAATRLALKHFGCTVEEVGSGEGLIEKLNNAKPGEFGLVMTDHDMGKMNGITACQEIRKNFPNLPLILYSALLDNEREEAMRALNGVCVSKPVSLLDLRNAIKEALTKSK